MANVLYYLGAGASYNTLPISSTFSESVEGAMADFANILRSQDGLLIAIDFNVTIKQLLTDFEWFQREIKNGITPDTLARERYKSDWDSFYKIKALINCLFIYIQGKNDLHYRYRSFIQHITYEDGHGIRRIRDSVCILTWNYDNQIEMAICNALRNRASLYESLLITEGQLIHINGRVDDRLEYNKGDNLVERLMNHDLATKNALEYYDSYLKLGRNARFETHYAWEDENDARLPRERAISKADFSNVEMIIVIGYSFPHDNFEIDRGILGKIAERVPIVIQTQKRDFGQVKTRLERILPTAIITQGEPNHFEVPSHLI